MTLALHSPNEQPEQPTSLEAIIALTVRRELDKALTPLLEHLKVNDPGPKNYTITQSCEYVGADLSDATARTLIRSGEWRAFRLNDSQNSKLFVNKASIDTWMQRRHARTELMDEGYPLESYLK
jgi:hypothetical protein